jgi:methyl-accepting chemotaxis protein
LSNNHPLAKANSGLIDGIARDSREQASAIKEISVAVCQIDEMTQHNAALVEQTNAAIEQTERQAGEIEIVVAGFKTSRLPSVSDSGAISGRLSRHAA